MTNIGEIMSTKTDITSGVFMTPDSVNFLILD